MFRPAVRHDPLSVVRDTDGGAARDGRSTRWDAHRARRREEVVDAALTVLEEHGPDFGLDQVAARAGVTKPVIYRHFADRAGLVQAMGERATNRLMERLMPAVYADTEPLGDRIRTSIAILVRFLDESPNVLGLFRPLDPGTTDVVRADKDYVAGALMSVLGGYLRALGTEETDAAEVWAHGMVGFVQNTVEWWLERRTPDRDRVVELLATYVWDQFDGIARRHGVALDPGEAVTPADIAARRDGDAHSPTGRGD